MNQFCLERKSLNGRSALLMCVVAQHHSLHYSITKMYEKMEHFKLAYFARLFHGRSIPYIPYKMQRNV